MILDRFPESSNTCFQSFQLRFPNAQLLTAIAHC